MAYNYKKLGKIVAEVLESGGYVYIHKLSDKTIEFQSPEQALSFIDRAREVFKLEDHAIIMSNSESDSSVKRYSTNKYSNVSITSTFVKPSTVDEDEL